MMTYVTKAGKASLPEDGHALRSLMGLQFFAEDAGADMDADSADGFDEAFLDADELESQQPETHEEAAEAAPEGLESQQPEAEAQDAGKQAAPVMATLTHNGRSFGVPQSALDALGSALGMDARSLIERGMNYEARGAREISLLDRYAKAGGYDSRAAYLEAMERQLGEHQVALELESLKAQYPEAPEQALIPLAERAVNDRNAQEKAAREREAQENARQAILQQGREKARPWEEFVKAHPECNAKSMDPEFYALVSSGLSPLAAYERMAGDKARQEAEGLRAQLIAAQKNRDNRQTAIGQLSSESEDADPFLSAFGDV